MHSRRLNFQIAAIFIIIIATFFGSALFFSTLNKDTLRTSIENEVDLAASLLEKDFSRYATAEEILDGKLQENIVQRLFSLQKNPDKDLSAWVVSPEGKICLDDQSGDERLFSEGSMRPELLNMLEQAAEGEVYTQWIGDSGLLLLRQDCCGVKALYEGRLYLILVDHCMAEKALQRQQFTLLMGIDFVLLLVMSVLIANIISNYRSQLLRLATTDELTGLANRKYFNAEFSNYFSQKHNEEACLFLLDIDYFKQINDNFGHGAGDHALRYLAEQIHEMVKRCNGFAGRWGGDEFIGVLPLSPERAYGEVEQLCRKIEGSKMEEGFQMTISAGVAPAGNETVLSKMSEKADLALYETKERGKNGVSLFRDDMSPAPSQPVVVRTAAERAVAQAEHFEIQDHPQQEKTSSQPAIKESFAARLASYVRERLIMSTILGVRWMAPFVAGGGILIGLAFLFDAASVDLSTLTVDARANFGSLTPLAATLKSIGGVTFNFMLPVFAGFMAYGIAGEDAFMAGFVGGYMTIDSNSGFIGAMIAGFAAGVIANEIQKFTHRLPKFIRKAAPIIIYPVFNLLLMQGICWVVIKPISATLGTAFTALLDAASARSQLAAGALSSMMMATDMGGIINKVAYNYGVSGLAQGHTGIMASVMAGGMVPPLGICLSMVLFRKKFTDGEWERGYGTLFMGLSFITEGALPYVFTDVVRVIPTCMAGSAVAGALSMLFGCELPAPHGGIFVLPVMTHPIAYLVALFLGSLVTAWFLGSWKKEPTEESQDEIP